MQKLPELSSLNEYYQLRIPQIARVLAHLTTTSVIDTKNLEGEVLDFGGAEGSGAYALSQYGGKVTAVDTCSMNRVIQNGILPPGRAIQGDGFGYLKTCPPEKHDLITAFLMQNDFPFYRFLLQVPRALKSGGQLILTAGLESDEEIKKISGLGTVTEIGTLCNSMDWYVFTYTKRHVDYSTLLSGFHI